jgi:hypothetical protein
MAGDEAAARRRGQKQRVLGGAQLLGVQVAVQVGAQVAHEGAVLPHRELQQAPVALGGRHVLVVRVHGAAGAVALGLGPMRQVLLVQLRQDRAQALGLEQHPVVRLRGELRRVDGALRVQVRQHGARDLRRDQPGPRACAEAAMTASSLMLPAPFAAAGCRRR